MFEKKFAISHFFTDSNRGLCLLSWRLAPGSFGSTPSECRAFVYEPNQQSLLLLAFPGQHPSSAFPCVCHSSQTAFSLADGHTPPRHGRQMPMTLPWCFDKLAKGCLAITRRVREFCGTRGGRHSLPQSWRQAIGASEGETAEPLGNGPYI
jgi:hypothetical protein